MDWLTTAREIFSHDIYATETTGIVIEEAEPGHAVCSFSIDKRHLNAHNRVMGGAIFTLADFAFAIAANSSILAEQKESLQWVSSSSQGRKGHCGGQAGEIRPPNLLRDSGGKRRYRQAGSFLYGKRNGR